MISKSSKNNAKGARREDRNSEISIEDRLSAEHVLQPATDATKQVTNLEMSLSAGSSVNQAVSMFCN